MRLVEVSISAFRDVSLSDGSLVYKCVCNRQLFFVNLVHGGLVMSRALKVGT
jgi:hypothetical protein